MTPTSLSALAARPLRILAVDDHRPIGDLLVQLLMRAGHACEHVSDGLIAWDKLSADLNHFDVVITDHEVPGLTGLDLVQLLREANYHGRIIVHCSSLEVRETENYRRFEVAAILAKPVDVEKLLRAVCADGAA